MLSVFYEIITFENILKSITFVSASVVAIMAFITYMHSKYQEEQAHKITIYSAKFYDKDWSSLIVEQKDFVKVGSKETKLYSVSHAHGVIIENNSDQPIRELKFEYLLFDKASKKTTTILSPIYKVIPPGVFFINMDFRSKHKFGRGNPYSLVSIKARLKTNPDMIWVPVSQTENNCIVSKYKFQDFNSKEWTFDGKKLYKQKSKFYQKVRKVFRFVFKHKTKKPI
ncbi:MAG: hypothetical protein LBB10_02280 [Bifidobacteriaceae bacterium]|jgi:hypothetical protein|nr:hypothetical protein [Bifidobacteriaceae bacterium]